MTDIWSGVLGTTVRWIIRSKLKGLYFYKPIISDEQIYDVFVTAHALIIFFYSYTYFNWLF